MLKEKVPILLASVEMKGQQIFTNSLKITKTETAIRMVNLRFRYRKICAPFVRIWLRRDEGC